MKRISKQVLSVLLSVCMLFSLGVPVYAAPEYECTHTKLVECSVCGGDAGSQCETCNGTGKVTASTLVAIEAKDPTCTKEGNYTYYSCSVCGKLFSDAEGKTATTEEDVVIPTKSHTWVNGTCSVCQTVGEHVDIVIPTPTEVTLAVGNVLTGNSMDSDEEFSFELKDASNKTVIETIQITGTGNQNFSALTFDKEGTYTYTVAEKKPETVTKGMVYDETVYTVTIVVTQDGEKLEAEVTYKDSNEKNVSDIRFNNIYTKASYMIGAEVKINVGTPPDADDFLLKLTPSTDATPMPDKDTLTINGATTGYFDKINFGFVK